MNQQIEIKTVVKNNNTVKFSHYRAGNLYYEVSVEENTYVFPVPIDDTGDATFSNEDRAMLFMRYIRKAIDEGSFAKIS